MTKEEIEHWRRFPLGNRALEVLQIIGSEKAMITMYEEYQSYNLFSFKTGEYVSALPAWQTSRLENIIKALEQRDYIRVFEESSYLTYIEEISVLIKNSMPDANISNYHSRHGDGFRIVSDKNQLDQYFSNYNEYLFITGEGLDYLAKNRERLQGQVEDKALDRWVVAKRISGSGEVLPGIGPIARFASETRERIYVNFDDIPESLNAQNFKGNDREINGGVETGTINGNRYWFIRKENLVTSNASQENCLDWMRKTLVAKEKLEGLKQREIQELDKIEKEYSALKNAIVDGLDASIKNVIDPPENCFVLTLTDLDMVEEHQFKM